MPGQKLAVCIMLVSDNNKQKKIPGGSILKASGDGTKQKQDFKNRTQESAFILEYTV